MTLKRIALTASAFVAIAGSANAQSIIACRPITEYGGGWLTSTISISNGSVQTWNGGAGWSQNFCATIATCSFSENAYVIRYQSRDAGQYAYSIHDNTITIERRTGYIYHDSVKHTFNLADDRPNPYNSPDDGTSRRNGYGSCEPTANPALAPPKF